MCIHYTCMHFAQQQSKHTRPQSGPHHPVDCRDVVCTDCSEEDRSTPEGECCPVCRDPLIDCNKVDCVLPVCKPDQQLFIPEGECCPICKPHSSPDCSIVLCIVPPCDDGKLVTPEGECCPICKTPSPVPLD